MGAAHAFLVQLVSFQAPITGILSAPADRLAPLTNRDASGVRLEIVEAPRIRVGTFQERSPTKTTSLVFDFAPIREGSEQDVRGILAATFFREKLIQFDFDRGVLRVGPREMNHAGLGSPLPLRVDDTGCPWVDNVQVGTRTDSFMIDTGANLTMTVHKWLFGLLLAEGNLRDAGQATGETVAGSQKSRRAWLNACSWGQYHHRDLLVEERGINSLGLEYLARYVVTIDVTGGWIYLRPGKDFNEPDKVDCTGLEVSKVDGALKVTSVGRGTPADVAGLLVGDTVVAVNGSACQQMRLMVFNKQLRDSFGEKLTLKVDRQGTQIEATLDVHGPEQAAASRESQPVNGKNGP